MAELEALVRKGVLIFAAASNAGGNASRGWPAKAPGVFCIHATKENAKVDEDMNPLADGVLDNFATLGCEIDSFWGGKEVLISGTSFATPMAAAIAANILEFARRKLDCEEDVEFRGYGPMRRLFRHYMTQNDRDGAYHYIMPWKLWEDGRGDEQVKKCLEECLLL